MTVEELIIYGKKYVHSDHAKMLLADLLNKNSLELLMNLQEKVPNEVTEEYKKKIQFLIEKKPIQYVIGTVNFYGNEFLVNDKVLIPRFETEELVEQTYLLIQEIFQDKKIEIIDLGTGSGCIGITLKKKLPNSNTTLLDISKDAIFVAQENAKRLEADVTIIENDMLEGIHHKYDVIISNPPYIKTEEEIEEIVKKNEPHLALYGGVDGLDYYRKILKAAKDCVKENFLIAFEIGDTQKRDVISIAKNVFPQATIVAKKDMQNRDRMIFIYQKDTVY